MRNVLFFSCIVSMSLLFNSCDTPLNEYKPQSDDEKQIISLLNTYAELRLEKEGRKVADAVFRLKRKGGLDPNKFASTKEKMDPVIDEILTGN